MEDDIDIEEHDVLDNPRIRTIFPDLAQIKKEIPDDYHGPDSQMEYQPYSESEDSRQHDQEDTSEYARFGNKIILGSKPSSTFRINEDIQNGESVLVFGRKCVEIKQEAEEYEETTDEVHHPEDVHEVTYNSASSVLILGSKPSSSGVIEPLTNNDVSRDGNELAKSKTKFFDQYIDLNCEDNDSDHDIDHNDPKDPTAALVLLENWGSRLENSSCYCKECLILFPTSNTLLAHNMTAHSFLVAVNKNKAVKSTAKPNVKKVSNDSGKFCNHCNKIFPDSDSLINHLYEKLTFDKNNTVFKPQPKKVVPNPSSKTVLPKQLEDDAEFGSEMQVYDQEAVYFYQCQMCSIYLDKYGCFVRHMFNNHSKTKFSEEKALFNGTCLLCNKNVKNKPYYNKHIKRFHPEVFNYKGPLPQAQVAKKLVARKKPILKVVPQTQSLKFQCQKCNAIFLSYGQARRHRETKHPESSSQNIFKKITNFKNKTICVQKARVPSKVGFKNPKNLQKGKVETQTQPEIIPSTSKFPQTLDTSDSIEKPRNQMVVPQSVLFKCNKCPVHFTSCTATVLHVKACGKQKGDWKCNICHRDFQNFDQTVHKRQHQISKNFFVIPYNEYIYGRVLNQCPNCELYFHEKDFYLHDQKSFCRGDGVKCDQCAFPIHTSSVEAHAKWHQRIDINKKNVIVVEFGYVVSENKTLVPAKRELEFSEQGTPAKKVRKELTKVHYCQTCGLFMFRGGAGHALNHVTGKCKHLPISKKKKFCKICGLTYASSSHTVFHKEHPEVSLMDMKFVSIKNREAIAPPIPVFPICNKCKVHFCKPSTVLTHNCNDSYKTCKYCQKRFSDLAFKLHVRFHDYIAKFKASKSIDLKKPKAKTNPEYLASPSTTKMTDSLPELLKNYEKLTDSWNILFSCETCDIVCDSYDRAVEHCQNHFNNMESYDMIIQNCEKCHLKFDGSCFEKHAELHAQNKKITKDSFTIVKYRYTTLLRCNWYLRFKCLPDTQLQQILSRSIYRHGRSVKLRVVRQGAPEITIYRCGKCETFVHPHIVSSHYKSVACNKKTPKFNCRYCGVLYNSALARDHHQELHKMGKPFTVVYFNEDGDDEFNEKLRDNDQVHENHIVRTKNSNAQSKVYRFYMCIKCKCCMATAMRRKYHRCPDANKIERCKICHLYFNVSILTRHTKFHELNLKLSKKNFKCIPFRPETSDAGFKIEDNNKEMPTVKLYKCQCGLHFTSTNAAEKHFKSCGDDSDTTKEKCSKCKRLFDTTQLVTHLCKHHSKDEKNTKFEIIKVTPGDKSKTQDHTVDKSAPMISDKRKNLYKCRRCDVCYLSAGGLAYHFETNHQVSKVRPCPHCQLKFMPMTLRKHITLQHQLIQCKAKDFIIRTGEYKDGLLKILDIESVPVNKASKNIINTNKVKKVNPKSDLSLIKSVHRKVNLAVYNNTLYKCKLCSGHFLTMLALKSHMFKSKSIERHRSGLVNCPDCNFTFKQFSLLRHIYVHHETMKLQREDFKIKCKDYLYDSDNGSDVENSDNKSEVEITSQDSADNSECLLETSGKFSESDNASSAVDTISYKTDNTDDLETSHVKNKQSKIFQYTSILYKCGICSTLFQSQSIEVHLKEHPSGNQELVPCFCGLNFSRATLLKHTVLHHDKQNLSKEDLYILTMGLYDKYAAGKHLFRCETCQVCFCKLKILENHLSTVGHSVQKSTCPHCGVMILTRSLPWHVKVHHGIMKLKREDFVVLESFGKNKLRLLEPLAKEETNSSEDLIQYKATLHKCGSCGTHYINASDLDLHQAICPQDTNDTVVCGQCQLKFSKNGLETHVETHHKNKQLKLDDFQIIDYGNDDNFAKDDDCKDLIAKDTEENSNEALTSARSTDNEDSLIDKDDETLEIKNTNINKLYQCGKCKTCFNTNRNIKLHYQFCKSIQPNKKCDQCQLMFPSTKSLNIHINRHHKSDNFKFYVILVNYDEKSALSQGVKIVSSNKPLEITENVSTLFKELYTNQLFKCNTCSIHFLLDESLEMHTKYPEVNISKSTCTCCGLIFSVNTLPTHIFIHHEKMKLNAEHFDITSKKEYMDDDSNILDSVNASSEEMALTSKDIHSSEDAHVTDTIRIDDTESDDEKETVIKKDADVVSTVTPAHSLDKIVEDELENSKDAPNSSRIDLKESETGNTIKLYKCAVCNVCFLSQTSCYKHVTKHITLDPKDYIECKLCGYQFLILNNSLHKHIRKDHRSNFKPENVLIEEYNPNVLCHGSPKIDIYFGTDKVQSKLISTTSDANVSSCSEDSEEDVKTSDNVTINLDSSVD